MQALTRAPPRTRFTLPLPSHLPIVLLAHGGAERLYIGLAGSTQAVVEAVVLVDLGFVPARNCTHKFEQFTEFRYRRGG